MPPIPFTFIFCEITLRCGEHEFTESVIIRSDRATNQEAINYAVFNWYCLDEDSRFDEVKFDLLTGDWIECSDETLIKLKRYVVISTNEYAVLGRYLEVLTC